MSGSLLASTGNGSRFSLSRGGNSKGVTLGSPRLTIMSPRRRMSAERFFDSGGAMW